MKNKKFILLFLFFIVYVWFQSFSRAVLPTYYLNAGLTLQVMIFGTTLVYLGQSILLALMTKLSARSSWWLTVVLQIIFLLLLINLKSVWQFYFACIASGITVGLFFMFYNIAYFENTPKDKTGFSSALMFSAPTVISIFSPLLAGFLGQISFNLIWLVSFISLVPVALMIFFQQNFSVSYTFKTAISEIKATRVFIFLEGIWEAMVFGIIPIYTLYFIKTPLGYGVFAAYLSIVGIVANLTLGRLTDRLQKRVVFLYPLTIVMALVTILFAFFSNSLTAWLILTAIISFLLPLFWNVSTAMVVDTHSNLRLVMPGRELMLALGRFLGLVLATFSFLLEKTPHLIYLVLGLTLLLYPLILWWRTKVSKEFSYL